VRTIRFVIAATIAAAVPSILVIRDVQGQEMIVMQGAAMPGMSADCNCRGGQRPPWHGSVSGEACGCGPVAQAHGMFHADSCGQLRARRHVHQGCVTLPPAFPRLHGMWVDGQMPSPPPPVMPRCHHCGAVIAGGF
jgi:hypothetical protein